MSVNIDNLVFIPNGLRVTRHASRVVGVHALVIPQNHIAFCNGSTDFAGLFLAKSCALCRFSQNSGLVLNACANSQAVCGVTPLFPLISSLIL